MTKLNEVYIVKDEKNILGVFSNHESAHKFMILKGVDYEQEFLTSTWKLDTVIDSYKYQIFKSRFYFGIFFYEVLNKSFEIVMKNIE